MLNPEFSYVSFDFETTGLDTKKDEVIQIGIVKFDHEFTITKTYTSRIKPRKPLTELKEIVRFITGFQLEDLEDAPYVEDILPEIQSFFDENTIIIGHNIGFDLAMLQKYRVYTPIAEIDTFIWGKACCHFKSSYALDVLHTEIKKKLSQQEVISYHDALADSIAAMELFHRCIQRITTLRHAYASLDYVIQESNGILKKIIKRTEKNYAFETKTLFFPALKNNIPSNKKLIIKKPLGLEEYIGKNVYIGAQSFQEILTNIDRSKRKYILAFTHKSKQLIAQQCLQKHGISTATLHDNIIFDTEQVNKFLQKKSFTDAEVLFVSKYYSHFEQGLSILDINSPEDYMIFSALTSRKYTQTTQPILCTHTQLFQLQNNISEDQTILFFDHDRRFTNRSSWMRQPFDPLHRLSFLEHACYKAKISGLKDQEEIYTIYTQQATIFVGVLSTEIDKLFITYTETKREVDPLIDNARFPKTKKLFSELNHLHTQCLQILEKTGCTQEQKKLEEHRKKLSTYLSEACEIEKRMYNGDKRFYVLHQRDIYTGYDEFLEQLPKASYIFLSNTNTNYEHVPTSGDTIPTGISLISQSNPNKLLNDIAGITTPQFIFSTSKHASQTLFNACMSKKLQETYTIVAENITGGIGKNIYLAQHSKKPILCIGGINFYLETLAKKFDFSVVYLYHIHGNKKEQLIQDIIWYTTS